MKNRRLFLYNCNMEEIWKDIEGYEGLYQVSSQGRVKSKCRYVNNRWGNNKKPVNEQILKPKTNKGGYYSVNLFKDGKYKTRLVHCLVAKAFIPNPDNLPQVNHKSEVRTENFVENLEWCDSKYNNNYGTRNKKLSEKRKGFHFSGDSLKAIRNGSKKRRKMVIQCNMDGDELCYWFSATSCYKETGFDSTLICRVCKGIYKQAYGYIWKYAEK